MPFKSLTALFLVIITLSVFSCKKTEEVFVNDNIAPPDPTIENVVVESYVNRSFISLLGRKPDPSEMSAGVVLLRTNNLSQANRESFINSVINKSGYNQHLFNQSLSYLLDNVDTTEIRNQVLLFELLLSDSGYIALWDYLAKEKTKMENVLSIPTELASGSATIVDMHERMVYNYIYDQLNMGSQNYVISLFQNFLFRYPTESERVASETMVNGFSSFIFLESGKNKEDFIRIFFESADYFEGQVHDLYNRFLFRDPDSQEMSSLSIEYKNSGDYNALVKTILTSNEFIGL